MGSILKILKDYFTYNLNTLYLNIHTLLKTRLKFIKRSVSHNRLWNRQVMAVTTAGLEPPLMLPF